MFKSAKDLQKDIYGNLAPYAIKETRGRMHAQPLDETRLPFQLDRDRIIHCKSFRRLDEKTQVFTASYGDHYRTRLTHTMEVAQISRDIARNLSLNEDLCEAIALAHDLGHPPFGHAGEDALNKIMRKSGLHFEHNEQSRRTVEKLEKLYPDFRGLNLTYEVLDGLIKHKTSWDQKEMNFAPPHLEAQVVNLADEIAYTNHDVDDGIRSKLFTTKDLGHIALWKKAMASVSKKHKGILDEKIKRYRCVSALINLMITDLYKQTGHNLDSGKMLISFSESMDTEIKELREFLTSSFYFTKKVQSQLDKGRKIISELFEFFLDNFPLVPLKLRDLKEKPEIAIKDYIAGMTDGFAKKEHERLVKKSK